MVFSVLFDVLLKCFSLLQIQRNLQLRIEEQGRCLQMMFEKQCQSGMEKLKTSSSSLENPSAVSTDAIQDSPENGALETSKNNNGNSKDDTGNSKTTIETQELGQQQEAAPNGKSVDDCEADVCETSSQPAKRPRTSE